MNQYHELVRDVLRNGVRKDDRTGTGTLSVFGRQLRFDLAQGFPLLTTKKLHWKSILHELLWFVSGDTNVQYLQNNGVRIWDEWADKNGDLGPIYGAQWRSWPYYWKEETDLNVTLVREAAIDQLQTVIQALRDNPDSRRHIISAWNVSDLPQMRLPPCHLLFQFYVAEGRLSCQLYQRSADVGLGLPFNIASYAAFTHMVAKVTGLTPGEFIWTGGDVHIYTNHVNALRGQILRKQRALPQLLVHGEQAEIDDFTFDDFEITGYDPHPAIRMKVAV